MSLVSSKHCSLIFLYILWNFGTFPIRKETKKWYLIGTCFLFIHVTFCRHWCFSVGNFVLSISSSDIKLLLFLLVVTLYTLALHTSAVLDTHLLFYNLDLHTQVWLVVLRLVWCDPGALWGHWISSFIFVLRPVVSLWSTLNAIKSSSWTPVLII